MEDVKTPHTTVRTGTVSAGETARRRGPVGWDDQAGSLRGRLDGGRLSDGSDGGIQTPPIGLRSCPPNLSISIRNLLFWVR